MLVYSFVKKATFIYYDSSNFNEGMRIVLKNFLLRVNLVWVWATTNSAKRQINVYIYNVLEYMYMANKTAATTTNKWNALPIKA